MSYQLQPFLTFFYLNKDYSSNYMSYVMKKKTILLYNYRLGVDKVFVNKLDLSLKVFSRAGLVMKIVLAGRKTKKTVIKRERLYKGSNFFY